MSEEPTGKPEDADAQPEQRKPKKLADGFTTRGRFAHLYIPPAAFSAGNIISDQMAGKFNRQIYSALRPKISPLPSYLATGFKYKSPLHDMAGQWNRMLRTQWEPLFEGIRKAIRSIYPDNWGEAHPPSVDVLRSIVVDEGIPLMWVPGPKS